MYKASPECGNEVIDCVLLRVLCFVVCFHIAVVVVVGVSY